MKRGMGEGGRDWGWEGFTLSEQPHGVTVISLLAGIMARGQTVGLQTLTQRPSGSIVLHAKQPSKTHADCC